MGESLSGESVDELAGGRASVTGDDERVAQAVALRVAGASFEVIATRLGFADTAEAIAAVREGLSSGVVDVDTEVLTDLARLDRLLVGVWRDAVAGDEGKTRVALKIIARRGELLASMPDVTSGSGGVSTPLDELRRRRAARGATA